MKSRVSFRCFQALAAILLASIIAGSTALAEAGAPANEPTAGAAEANRTQELLRSVQDLQQQLQATRRALDQARLESSVMAASNAAVLAERLRGLEAAVDSRREQDLKTMTAANQTLLIVFVSLAILVVLAVLFGVWMQMQATRRLAEAAALLRAPRALETEAPPRTLGQGETVTVSSDPARQAGGALQDSLQRLLLRMERIEESVSDQSGRNSGRRPASMVSETASALEAPAATSPVLPQGAIQAHALIEGQILLDQGQAQEALDRFEAALAADPENTELLVKRGMAHERLQQMDEALASYDRALALNNSLTTAYLLKAGVLSRLKRESEAFDCYQMALRHQPKPA